MTRLALLFAPALMAQHANAFERIIDGDTIVLPGNESVRLMGIDTPELRGKCPAEIALAEAAKTRLQALLSGGYEIERHGQDKYRRTLARVTVDGQDVAGVLIREGLGRAYSGGRRQGWCSGE